METNEPRDTESAPAPASVAAAPPAPAEAEPPAETGAPVSSAPATVDLPAAVAVAPEGQPREERPRRDDRPPREGRPPRDQRRGPQGQGRGPQGRPGGRDRPDQRSAGPPQGHQPQGRQPWSKPDFLARAVKDGIDKEFIDGAAEFARSVGSAISPIHLRGIFGELARQEVSGPDPVRLLLIRPRLAYLTARAGRAEMKDLRQVIERGLEPVCAEGVSDEERAARLDRLCRGVEAIFAYQKMHERKGGERP